jgi:hypothetical protein
MPVAIAIPIAADPEMMIGAPLVAVDDQLPPAIETGE